MTLSRLARSGTAVLDRVPVCGAVRLGIELERDERGGEDLEQKRVAEIVVTVWVFEAVVESGPPVVDAHLLDDDGLVPRAGGLDAVAGAEVPARPSDKGRAPKAVSARSTRARRGPCISGLRRRGGWS